MDTIKLRKIFNQIKEETNGDNTSNSDILDYKNGYSISIYEIEEEYYKYLQLEQDIDEYCEINDLDNIKDKEKIIEYFTSKIKSLDYRYFKINQAVLIDFISFMKLKIDNKKDYNINELNNKISKFFSQPKFNL